MSTPNGYNNPAYCHQYESSLYDYQYVPEIDPDSPNLEEEFNRKTPRTKLVHPGFGNVQKEFSDSSEFEGSDESNRSIIIEECNNRRVTLICEKKNEADVSQDELKEDGHFSGAYYQDISLESENGYQCQETERFYDKQKTCDRSLRHQRILKPPIEQPVGPLKPFITNNNDARISRRTSFKDPTFIRSYQRPQRHHRYEEIPFDEDCLSKDSKPTKSVHRYAEITVDENGYPTLSDEIRIEQSRDRYQQKINPTEVIAKPRAISPINPSKSFSSPPTPNRSPQKTLREFDPSISRFPNSPTSFIYSSSPIKTNSFEMSELSPPRLSSDVQMSDHHTFFINSPKRQPPIGASAASELRESSTTNRRCILPKNLQQSTRRCQSQPNSPRRQGNFSSVKASPRKTQSNKKISQIFVMKSSQPKYKLNTRTVIQNENSPARRNISNYFLEKTSDGPTSNRSPYKATTTEINPAKTAIITPIFQRKSQLNPEMRDNSLSPKRNFEKMSLAFQSTGNIFRSTKEAVYPCDADFSSRASPQKQPTRIKRNQSVPNFSQALAAESRMISRKTQDVYDHSNEKYSMNLDLQYSPKKPIEHLSQIDKSRVSLINQTSSWSNLDSDYHPKCSTCFIFAALVHLVTASATCAITFYLLSKVGRKYYLDFGLLAGFVNFILGLLGFRSYCWRWLPNRNYVSGFIGLAAFSALTCAGLTYLITARPMAGDPILDIMGGAICAVSVLTIVLALTGLTMSGCCKTPPPDNRVTNI